MKTQIEIIKEKLLKERSVTNVWAVQHYILRLSDIIFRLRKDGMNIEGGYIIKRKTKTKNYEYTLA